MPSPGIQTSSFFCRHMDGPHKLPPRVIHGGADCILSRHPLSSKSALAAVASSMALQRSRARIRDKTLRVSDERHPAAVQRCSQPRRQQTPLGMSPLSPNSGCSVTTQQRSNERACVLSPAGDLSHDYLVARFFFTSSARLWIGQVTATTSA